MFARHISHGFVSFSNPQILIKWQRLKAELFFEFQQIAPRNFQRLAVIHDRFVAKTHGFFDGHHAL